MYICTYACMCVRAHTHTHTTHAYQKQILLYTCLSLQPEIINSPITIEAKEKINRNRADLIIKI